MKGIIEKPNLEYKVAGAQPNTKHGQESYVLDISAFFRDKSDKKMRMQQKDGYDLLSFADKKGHGYFFTVADGEIKGAYIVGVTKEELKDPQSVIKQYMDVLSKYAGFKKGA